MTVDLNFSVVVAGGPDEMRFYKTLIKVIVCVLCGWLCIYLCYSSSVRFFYFA